MAVNVERQAAPVARMRREPPRREMINVEGQRSLVEGAWRRHAGRARSERGGPTWGDVTNDAGRPGNASPPQSGSVHIGVWQGRDGAGTGCQRGAGGETSVEVREEWCSNSACNRTHRHPYNCCSCLRLYRGRYPCLSLALSRINVLASIACLAAAWRHPSLLRVVVTGCCLHARAWQRAWASVPSSRIISYPAPPQHVQPLLPPLLH